jgi:hypothetical protein
MEQHGSYEKHDVHNFQSALTLFRANFFPCQNVRKERTPFLLHHWKYEVHKSMCDMLIIIQQTFLFFGCLREQNTLAACISTSAVITMPVIMLQFFSGMALTWSASLHVL